MDLPAFDRQPGELANGAPGHLGVAGEQGTRLLGLFPREVEDDGSRLEGSAQLPIEKLGARPEMETLRL